MNNKSYSCSEINCFKENVQFLNSTFENEYSRFIHLKAEKSSDVSFDLLVNGWKLMSGVVYTIGSKIKCSVLFLQTMPITSQIFTS